MATRLPFDVPDEVIWDVQTGYALNIPVAYQGEPRWWERDTATYAIIKVKREQMGITIDDFPNGEDVPLDPEDALVMEEPEVTRQRLEERVRANDAKWAERRAQRGN